MVSSWNRALQCLPISGPVQVATLCWGWHHRALLPTTVAPNCSLGQWVPPPLAGSPRGCQTQLTIPQVHLEITDALAIGSHTSPADIGVDHAAVRLPAGNVPLQQGLAEPG